MPKSRIMAIIGIICGILILTGIAVVRLRRLGETLNAGRLQSRYREFEKE